MDCNLYYHDYYSVIENDFDAIPPEHREHLRTCPTCRQNIETLSASLEGTSGATLSHRHLALHLHLLECAADCDAIKPFLPCLAMSSGAVCVRTPITAHLEACPACRRDYEVLAALRLTDTELLEASRFLAEDVTAGQELSERLQRVLTAIRNRPPSGVVTISGLSAQQEEVQTETVRIPTSGWTVHRRRFLKAAVSGLAAAMGLIAVLLFVHTPSAEALELHQFYAALANVQNISIQTMVHEETDPIQHIQISQTLGLMLFESPEKAVLYDLNTQTLTQRDNTQANLPTRSVQSAAPRELQLPWGLLPFRDITYLRDGFAWKRLDAFSDRQTVVYELSWVQPLSSGREMRKKWIGTLDRNTHLPQKIEWYERFDEWDSYKPLMTLIVTYPSTEAVIEAIDRSGLDTVYGRQR